MNDPGEPLSYTDARPVDVLAPLIRAAAILLLAWSCMDGVYYLMQWKLTQSAVDLQSGYYYSQAQKAGAALGAAANFIMAAGAWQALRRRPKALDILFAGECVWLASCLAMQLEWVAYYTTLAGTPPIPGTDLAAHPRYTLVMELLRQASQFVVIGGWLYILRLRVLRDYFAAYAQPVDPETAPL